MLLRDCVDDIPGYNAQQSSHLLWFSSVIQAYLQILKVKQKFSDKNYLLQKLIRVILHILCCIKSGNIVFNITAGEWEHNFELRLIFSFEQSSFDYEKNKFKMFSVTNSSNYSKIQTGLHWLQDHVNSTIHVQT